MHFPDETASQILSIEILLYLRVQSQSMHSLIKAARVIKYIVQLAKWYLKYE